MATTRLMPLHAGKGRTVAEALGRVTDYVENPEKTNGGDLVTAYQCNPSIADQEFLFSKRQYAAITGRDQGDSNVIAYHLRQSFKPGEITPELANKIGYDVAMSLTKGKHAFIVCTHVDKHHIHSHVVFNSTTMDCTRKFNNFWGSSFAVRKISDLLCLENGLSVIAEPKPNMLIDIQAKMQQANSPGFERWAKIYNIKEMAKTLLYLQEHSLMDYAKLEKTCDAAVQKYNSLSSQTKAANERMRKISELQKHIGAYGKTREVYAQYKKLPPKKQQQFYADHTGEIISCEAAKRFFDSLGLKKLPSIQSLKREYAILLAENKKLYPEQKKAKAEMMELLTAKHNVMRILGLTEQNTQHNQHQEER